MKLYEYTNKQYVILETAYDAKVVDATYEEDDYNISLAETMESSELNDAVNGLIDPPEDNVEVWRGTVTSVSGTENVTIYIPESWD